MRDKNLTELVFILDRSGSMRGLESDTIGGYNGLLNKQKREVGDAYVTTVLFDDKYEMVHDCVNIKKTDPMTEKQYYARGMTALLDAIGKTINTVGSRQKQAPYGKAPSKTMFVIITDGFENASREFSLSRVRKMIEHQQQKFGWEFMFLGANIDAISTAADFGIRADRAVTYYADAKGTKMNFEAVCNSVSSLRSHRPIDKNWKEDIESYERKNNKK